MNKIRFSINGQQFDADQGATIMQVALENHIYIPHLCYNADLVPGGVCRLCMVEVNNEKIVLACRTLAENEMIVKTNTPEIDAAIRPVVELIIADHHFTCRECPANGKCELQKIMAHLHIDRRRIDNLRPPKNKLPLETLTPFLYYDPNKCVRCGICVQTCEKIYGASHIYFVNRGYETKIACFESAAHCDFCMECVKKCPVGVLIPKTE
ncbi:MAG: 2Fe-2S iron-sulfur cluster-binding protein [Dehalococcoidales bacterium]|nr:2Fe-2S iron-sulfur cluster-binding protein [Dehalococcoidales bacterium]